MGIPENHKEIPQILRERDYHCGPAALQLALHLIGITSDQIDLAYAAGYSKTWGTPRKGLLKAARAFGAKAIAFERLTLKHLRRLTASGAVALVNSMQRSPDNSLDPISDGHYWVYLGHNEGEVRMFCSSTGLQSVPRRQFEHDWWDLPQDKRGKLQISRGWALILFSNGHFSKTNT